MATVRKLRSKWQAQVRVKGHKPQAKSFTLKSDAQHGLDRLKLKYSAVCLSILLWLSVWLLKRWVYLW